MTEQADPALRHDPSITDPPGRLRERLAGVRGLVLDADGVLVMTGRAIAGAPEALAELDRRGMPWRVVTNASASSRHGLAATFAARGLAVPAARITTAASAAAEHTARHYGGRPLYVIATPEARVEFAGQWLVSADEADKPDARVAAVVLGDAEDDLSYRAMDRCFRLVRAGAALLAMHRNAWWLTEHGPTIDLGAFVAGLEVSTGARATVLGKPSPSVFRRAAAELAAEVATVRGASRQVHLSRGEVAMVGDDLAMDIIPARRAGLRGVLVLSGRDGPAELAAAARRARGGRVTDAVASSLAALVAALD